MSNITHIAAPALPRQPRVIYPDSVVITLGGNVKSYAQYHYDLHNDKAEMENFPLLILNPDELNPRAIRRLRQSGYYREHFIAGTKAYYTDQSPQALVEYYDQQEQALFSAISAEDIVKLAPEQITHGEHHTQELIQLLHDYDDASDDRAYYAHAASQPEHSAHTEAAQQLAGCEQFMQTMRQYHHNMLSQVRPTEPLSPQQRQGIRGLITRRIRSLPPILRKGFEVGGYQCAIMPIPDTFQLGSSQLHDTHGYASPIERTLIVLSDCSQKLFNEEVLHLVDLDIGFSASAPFAQAYAAETKEGIMAMDEIAHILLSSTIIGQDGKHECGASKRPLLANDGDDYRSLFADNDPAFFSEVLANLMHCETMLPTTDAQKNALHTLGIHITGNNTLDHQAICDKVAEATPHLWRLYKGRDNLPSFAQAVENAIKEEHAAQR